MLKWTATHHVFIQQTLIEHLLCARHVLDASNAAVNQVDEPPAVRQLLPAGGKDRKYSSQQTDEPTDQITSRKWKALWAEYNNTFVNMAHVWVMGLLWGREGGRHLSTMRCTWAATRMVNRCLSSAAWENPSRLETQMQAPRGEDLREPIRGNASGASEANVGEQSGPWWGWDRGGVRGLSGRASSVTRRSLIFVLICNRKCFGID